MCPSIQERNEPMVSPVMNCPYCQKEIKLTESLAAPLLEATRKEYEKKLSDKDTEIGRREAAVRKQEKAVADAKKQIEDQVTERVRAERQKIATEEAKKARLAISDELNGKAKNVADLQAIVKAKDDKLAEAQRAQAELIRKQRELDDAKREFDLTVEKRIQESLGTERSKAKKEAELELNLKVAERDEKIASMQRQIEALKQKAEQGSQQLQGEVQELELEELLAAKFPVDIIEPVPKGEFGGDITHQVIGSSGQLCGKIFWESKRTKNWSDAWLAKLRNDQRTAKADLAILVSRALPKGMEAFDLMDGVWVVEPRYVVPVTIALRQCLMEVAAVRLANRGQESKAVMVYQYLTGPTFRARIQTIVEKFTDMEQDLVRERNAMTRLWAKREEQIRAVIEATAGMYGDLQGIAGKGLEEIEGLELTMLPAPEHE
jgi:hypothetical protein